MSEELTMINQRGAIPVSTEEEKNEVPHPPATPTSDEEEAPLSQVEELEVIKKDKVEVKEDDMKAIALDIDTAAAEYALNHLMPTTSGFSDVSSIFTMPEMYHGQNLYPVVADEEEAPLAQVNELEVLEKDIPVVDEEEAPLPQVEDLEVMKKDNVEIKEDDMKAIAIDIDIAAAQYALNHLQDQKSGNNGKLRPVSKEEETTESISTDAAAQDIPANLSESNLNPTLAEGPVTVLRRNPRRVSLSVPGAFVGAFGEEMQRRAGLPRSQLRLGMSADRSAGDDDDAEDQPGSEERAAMDASARSNSGLSGAFSNLSHAFAVDETEAAFVDLQEEIRRQELRDHRNQKYRNLSISMAAIICGVVTLSLILVMVFLIPKDGQNATSDKAPSEQPFLSLQDYTLSLLPEYSRTALEDKASPQSKAFQWVLEDPILDTYPDWRILQRFALGAVFFATNGYEWFENTNWLSYDQHECQWYSRNTSVDEIESLFMQSWSLSRFETFDEADLNESLKESYPGLPSTACSDGQVYQHLLLSNNNLEGDQIPQELYLLTSLRSLFMERNPFMRGSTISPLIGNLASLELLEMTLAGLGGTIPTQIGLLSNLTLQGLNENRLEGKIPSQLGLLSHTLQNIGFDNNDLSGTLPTELFQLSNLKWVFMSGNKLTGSVPSQLGLLSRAQIFRLSINNFDGTIPTQLGLLSDTLGSVGLAYNKLRGTLPSQLGRLTKLVLLIMSDNLVTGALPTELGKMSNLFMLATDQNKFTGTIPTQIGLMKSLLSLYMNSADLTGPIPTEFGQLQSLEEIILVDNQLSGTIPTEIGALNNLWLFNVWENLISGSIPSELGLLSQLRALGLKRNLIGGSIPKELDVLSAAATNNGSLCSLNIEGNTNLIGTISSNLCSIDNGERLTVPYPWIPRVRCGVVFDCSGQLCGCDCPCPT